MTSEGERYYWGRGVAPRKKSNANTNTTTRRYVARHRMAETEGQEMTDLIERLTAELAECRKDAEENATLRSAISLYEAALKEAFPRGAKGRTFDMWNSARIIREAKP